jgi:hypothetical protein
MTTLEIFEEGSDEPFRVVRNTFIPLVGEITSLPDCCIKVLKVEEGPEVTRVVVKVLEWWG